MWMFGMIVFVYSVTVHGEDECLPGKYGDNCKLDCPENCHVPPNTLMHCQQNNGKCFEGCNDGFYGDLCNQPCSRNCEQQICNQHNGHCSVGCIVNHIGNFCEIKQEKTPVLKGTTNGSQTTETTRVAPTTRSSVESVDSRIIIPVVVVTVLVLVASVCTVIILMRCRKREVQVPEGQDLLSIKSHRSQVEREDTYLHIACKRGNVDEVKHVLSKRLTNINTSGLYGWTPLMAAARYGQRGVFDFLVSKGCDEEMVDDSGNNILHVACLGGNLKLVKSILSKETVDINSRGHCGRTPIMAAVRKGHKHVLKTLLSRGCDASLVDDDRNNILHYACIGGHLTVVQHILQKTALDINSKGKHGMTPVMISVEIRHRQMFDFLVQNGAELSQVDDNGNNILHLTCSGGNVSMVTDLLAKDSVDINSRGQNGGTALMWATWWQQSDVIDLLVSKGADASLIDNDGNNILHHACIGGHLEVVQYILKRTSLDINSKGKHGMTPVMISVDAGHMLVFDFLVFKEADLSHVDDNGNNILHLACLWGRAVIAKYILSKHIVDIDSKGQSSRTPVMMAALGGHKEVFNVLVNAGAKLSNIDASGNNILHLGCLGGSVSIVQNILSKNVIDINVMNHDGSLAAIIATEQGHSSICELLMPQPTN